mgnify:FL=1
MDFLTHPVAIFVVGCWVGVFVGIIIVGLLNKENKD